MLPHLMSDLQISEWKACLFKFTLVFSTLQRSFSFWLSGDKGGEDAAELFLS